MHASNRPWEAITHPTDSSKPSAVKVGSLAVGRYTAALATRASRRRPLHDGQGGRSHRVWLVQTPSVVSKH